jgi:gliding motility-associated lipoprotein GldK
LPTEAEWEYAARGGRTGTDYPWGGPYIRNSKGCLLANFKPGRGNYSDDGGTYTVKVRSYLPNDYGLYCMAGNVAEWTSSAFDPSASTFVNDLAPTFNYEARKNEAEVMKRKVVRGGSWKDVGYFLQNASRSYEYQDSAKSYIGFRCVTHFLGRDLRDRH